MLNGGMTPWDYYQGSFNNAVNGNEVQMRMQQLKNQQIQQQLEYQLQMQNFAINKANSEVNRAHTQAETYQLQHGGAEGISAQNDFDNAYPGGASSQPNAPAASPVQNLNSAPAVSGSSPFSGNDPIVGSSALPAPDATPAPAPQTSDDSPDAAYLASLNQPVASAGIANVIAAKMQPQQPDALPSNPSQGDPSQLVAPNPDVSPLPAPASAPSPAISAQSSSAPTIMGQTFDPAHPIQQIRKPDGSAMGTLHWEAPNKGFFKDMRGNKSPFSLEKPGGYASLPEVQAAFPGAAVESVHQDPISGRVFADKVTPGVTQNAAQRQAAQEAFTQQNAQATQQRLATHDLNDQVKDLKDQWGRDQEVQNAQNAVAAYDKFKSTIGLQTGVGDKLAMEALQSIFNPKQAVSVGALKNMQSFGLGKYLDPNYVENMLKTGASIPDADRLAMSKLAEQAITDGQKVLQAKRSSAMQTAQDIGIPADTASHAMYDPYSVTSAPTSDAAKAIPSEQSQQILKNYQSGVYDSDPVRKKKAELTLRQLGKI